MEALPQHYRAILSRFEQISKSFVRLNVIFLGLAAAEVALFLLFLPAFSDSSGLAVALAVMFLTVFAYPLLSFYYQAKKPEQLNGLLAQLIASCKTTLNLNALSTAETLVKLSHHLTGAEWQRVGTFAFFAPVDRLVKRISAFCYWSDMFRFKQLLLHAAIEEHLQQIRQTPTDLEAHASLANVYVALSQLYKKPTGESMEHPRHSLYEKRATLFEERFKTAAKLAIEEFQILSQYAPNDPWIHEQLANGYRELGLYTDQIREMESLSKLKPQDREILFTLGSLYFQQGLNAKGLRVYDELKKARFTCVEELLTNYGKTATSERQITPISL